MTLAKKDSSELDLYIKNSGITDQKFLKKINFEFIEFSGSSEQLGDDFLTTKLERNKSLTIKETTSTM